MIYDYVQNKGFKGIKANPLKHAYVADAELMDPIMIHMGHGHGVYIDATLKMQSVIPICILK